MSRCEAVATSIHPSDITELCETSRRLAQHSVMAAAVEGLDSAIGHVVIAGGAALSRCLAASALLGAVGRSSEVSTKMASMEGLRLQAVDDRARPRLARAELTALWGVFDSHANHTMLRYKALAVILALSTEADFVSQLVTRGARVLPRLSECAAGSVGLSTVGPK